jgi:hypothetical protein
VTRPAQSLPLRRGSASARPSRRVRRFVLQCEPLESRQLLSIGQTGLAAGVLVNPSAANGQVSVPAIVSNFNPPNFETIEIEFGAIGGLNQIQVIVLGTTPVFAPTPTSPSGAGGSGPGIPTGVSGNVTSGVGLGSATTTSISAITPLNPNLTSTTNTSGGPVSLVPPPLMPLPVHLGASASPTTAISDSVLISLLDEKPPSLTHQGQADTFAGRRVFFDQPIEVRDQSSSLIDDVEPFGKLPPLEVPAAVQPGVQIGQPQAPDAAPARPLPPLSDANIDAALDLTDGRVLTRTHDGQDSQTDDELSTNTSWSFSALFGAAAIAAGGYHLAMRERDRFQGRSIPRWMGAERPNKRKLATPTR